MTKVEVNSKFALSSLLRIMSHRHRRRRSSLFDTTDVKKYNAIKRQQQRSKICPIALKKMDEIAIKQEASRSMPLSVIYIYIYNYTYRIQQSSSSCKATTVETDSH